MENLRASPWFSESYGEMIRIDLWFSISISSLTEITEEVAWKCGEWVPSRVLGLSQSFLELQLIISPLPTQS